MTLQTTSEADRDWIVGVTPLEQPNAELVVALCHAGALGVLDVGRSANAAFHALERIAQRWSGPFAVRVPVGSRALLPSAVPEPVTTVVLARAQAIASWRPRRVLVEVTSLEEGRAAAAAGADGLIAKGSESGGRISEASTFVLLQQLVRELSLPIWAQGGIGEHTAAAAIAGGARGVVLDAQLALARESLLPEPVRTAIAAMDGSQTTVLGGHRLYTRPDLPIAELSSLDPEQVAERLGADLRAQLVPLGQDAAFARGLARRFKTAGGIAHALRRSIGVSIEAAQRLQPLAAGSRFAAAHGVRHPIAQGPMTRVSDSADFAAAVAAGGALPFLALALMSAAEVRALLEQTVALLGSGQGSGRGSGREARPWGVGILGFVPPEIRDAQLEVVREFRPPFALIAGGRPAQARALEQDGTATYLHVPSPGLLRQFLKEGARRFVFEGRECGGHVGPRSSFVLWETQLEVLRELDDCRDLHVLFAGGIHDGRSAAMVSALAAPLAERGAHVGVLIGSAYIFTQEAVATGAIQPRFQEEIRRCGETALLETSPGHAIRVARTGYVDQFRAHKRELEANGRTQAQIWEDLEQLNLGRLRLASKGLRREADRLLPASPEEQLRDGMFMIGQIATLRDRVISIAELHREVSEGAARILAGAAVPQETTPVEAPLDIAIVGMAACFPQAPDLDAFWANIVHGVDAVTEVPAERWDIARYYHPDGAQSPDGVRTPSKWGGFLPAIPFDALAYGIPPRSLGSIEPAQLLGLEIARRALADAGYADREFDRSRTAVIFGAAAGTDLSAAYGFRALVPQYAQALPEGLERALPQLTEDSFPGVLSNVIAGRIANRLDLGGANFTVDAACAASLAALNQACKELTTGSSDMVLCGAADLHNAIGDYLLFASVQALSKKGRCRSFDAEADGIALGEGVACVVLKRLADAERDGDRIYAVLKGLGSSSDGRSLGLTAPRPDGQRRALERAYRQAAISPAQVGLVEAHGTGTVVGDRTELAVLTELFRDAGAQPGSAALGSVKSQIGHTKCAAGLAGLLKTALSLYCGVRAPTLHLRRPSDYYDPEHSPFHFSASARPWPAAERHAGVSAFGFGGSNFHAVLSAHAGSEVPARGVRQWPAELVLVRGADREQARHELARAAELLSANAAAGSPWRLRDLARTLSEASTAPVQLAIVAESLEDLRHKLEQALGPDTEPADGVFARPADAGAASGQLAFLFPGQGSQRVGMLADLFVAFPRLRSLLELGARQSAVVFPSSVFSPEQRLAQQQQVTDTRVAQPALGVAGLALAALLREFGVAPDLAAGHSYGELVALCAAGVFTERELLALSGARARAILDASGDDPGAMAAVDAPVGEVLRALEGLPRVVVANENAPRQTVVSGPSAGIDAALERLARLGLAARRLPVACAFHSPVVEAAVETFAKQIAELELGEPAFPVWSNTTARPYPLDTETAAGLLARQLASPVRFREQIESMYAAGARIFVEAGPGRVLTGLVGKILGERPHRAICCDVPGEPGLPRFLRTLAELAVLDVPLDLEALYGERDAQRVELESLRAAKPRYLVNGYTVRSLDGEVVAGGLPPADVLASLASAAPTAPAGPALPTAVSDREAAVQVFLRSMRETIAAQREVMLAYLGAPAAPVERAELAPSRPERAVAAPARTPAAPPAPPAEGAAAAAARGPLRGDALMAAVLAIVSERTGYPAAMLEPDLDLEADLSIDSIKRMEILGELAERVSLPAAHSGASDESSLEQLARLKTLRQIVTWIDGQSATEDAAPAAEGAAPPVRTEPAAPPVRAERAAEVRAAAPARAQRYRFELAEIDPALPAPISFAGRRFAVAGGPLALQTELADRIAARRGEVRVADLAGSGDSAAAGETLIHLGALDVASELELVGVFESLRAAALAGVRAVRVVTGLGGSLGLDLGLAAEGAAPPLASPALRCAGVRGLVKSFAREFPNISFRTVDVDLGEPDGLLLEQLLAELDLGEPRLEVGYARGVRRAPRLVAAPLEPAAADARIALERDAVVLVTGGARGIAARASLALARTFGCRLELAGRSPLPSEPERESLAHCPDARALRRALAESGLGRPAQIEAECARLLAGREIRATLRGLRELEVDVAYHALDVRDGAALGALVRDIYARHGRLDGVIHAAGVLEDRWIRDKTPESFRRVFDTKVGALHALARELRPDVRFVVCFGSISGAFGNRGQVDYAAANDALATLGRALARHVEGRVVTLDWGPWGGTGMVSAELASAYARRGVGLIDPADGVECLLRELASRERDCHETVWMCGEPEGALAATADEGGG